MREAIAPGLSRGYMRLEREEGPDEQTAQQNRRSEQTEAIVLLHRQVGVDGGKQCIIHDGFLRKGKVRVKALTIVPCD